MCGYSSSVALHPAGQPSYVQKAENSASAAGQSETHEASTPIDSIVHSLKSEEDTRIRRLTKDVMYLGKLFAFPPSHDRGKQELALFVCVGRFSF